MPLGVVDGGFAEGTGSPDWLHDPLDDRMIAFHLCPPLRLELCPGLEVDGGVIELTMRITVIILPASCIDGTIQLARLSPRKVVKVPEGIDGKDEIPDGKGDDVDEEPDDVERFEGVKRMRRAGRPRMAARRIKGIHWGVGTNVETISTPVNVMAAGRTKVPASSMKMTNCMEQQKMPHKSRTRTSSKRL